MKKITTCLAIMIFVMHGLPALAESGSEIIKFGKDYSVNKGSRVENVVIIGGHLTVDGTVEKDAVAVGGGITIGPSANIKGQVVSVGGAILRARTAKVGKVVEVDAPGVAGILTMHPTVNTWAWLLGTLSLIAMLGMLVLAIVIAALFSKHIEQIGDNLDANPGLAFLTGIGGIILILPITFTLLISLIGIPLIPFEILLLILAFIIGYVSAAMLIGTKLLASLSFNPKSIIISTITGMITLGMIGFVPIIGWLMKSLVFITGLGAVLLSVFRKKQPR